MDDLHLLDFIELRLKSKADFDAAYDVIMSTSLAAYMKKFLVFQPGDWPCQFYSRQIIYESLKTFISSQPVLKYTPVMGHEFEPRRSPEFFQASSFQLLKWKKFTAMITLHFHLLPQYKYELFHIYFT